MDASLPRPAESAPVIRVHRQRINWTPYLFLIIPLAIYFMWIVGPTFYTFYLSLTDWDGVDAVPTYIGFDNYERLIDDSDFEESFTNNVRWLVVFVTVPTTIGLALAMIFNTDLRGSRWFKISFYSPLILSFVVIGMIWTWIYEPRGGLINSLLMGLGMDRRDTPGWLADRDLALWAIIFAAVWRQVGYVMILYLAGLKNLDPSLIEAGRVDGATGFRLFRFIIFPLLGPITTVVMVISVIDSLRAFDLVSIMTRGERDTNVLAYFMYKEAFNNYKMGYGATIAVALFGLSLLIIIPYLYRSIRTELEY
jgi:multiple sugar transport system permease protein